MWWIKMFIKFNVFDYNIIMSIAEDTSLGLHCCSEWFEQLQSRISNDLTSGGYSNRSEIVHRMWLGERWSGSRLSDQHWLRCNHGAVSLRHCSKCRHVSRITLHCGSLRERRRSVCNYGRIRAVTTPHYKGIIYLSQIAVSMCRYDRFLIFCQWI